MAEARAGARPPRHWWAKSIAGVVLGFTLGILVGVVVMRFGSAAPGLRAQWAMWAVVPVWALALSLVFACRSGWRAWGWLGLANLLVVLLLCLA